VDEDQLATLLRCRALLCRLPDARRFARAVGYALAGWLRAASVIRGNWRASAFRTERASQQGSRSRSQGTRRGVSACRPIAGAPECVCQPPPSGPLRASSSTPRSSDQKRRAGSSAGNSTNDSEERDTASTLAAECCRSGALALRDIRAFRCAQPHTRVGRVAGITDQVVSPHTKQEPGLRTCLNTSREGLWPRRSNFLGDITP
jgi:hypothetical protein